MRSVLGVGREYATLMLGRHHLAPLVVVSGQAQRLPLEPLPMDYTGKGTSSGLGVLSTREANLAQMRFLAGMV